MVDILQGRQLGGSPFADGWLRQYYNDTASGQGLLRLIQGLLAPSSMGTRTPQPGTPRMHIPQQSVAPGRTDLPSGAGAAITPPIPQTTVPGAQTLPTPQPTSQDNIISGIARLSGQPFGPSISPSQAGTAPVTQSPSQGPGAAVTPTLQDKLGAKLPSILEALKGLSAGGGGGGSMPQAPAPPSPSRLAPGAVNALLGGQNPLAQQRAPQMALLSQLLRGG